MAKLKQILVTPHELNCVYRIIHSPHPWAFPDIAYLQRDRIGRPNTRTHTTFLRFRCNDPDCRGEMLIHAETAMREIGVLE